MNMRRAGLAIMASLLAVGVFAAPVYGASSLDAFAGGSKSSDYQPPTDNPQNNVASGLQNTTTTLQPVPGQGSVNQQNLGTTTNLQVVGTKGKSNPNTTTASTNKAENNSINPFVYVAIGVVVVGAAGYAAAMRNVPKESPISALEPAETSTPKILAKPKKVKKPVHQNRLKKKSAKKRKTKK
jgi:hypothetical protein